jgi:hypothetical protein
MVFIAVKLQLLVLNKKYYIIYCFVLFEHINSAEKS